MLSARFAALCNNWAHLAAQCNVLSRLTAVAPKKR